MYLQRPDITCKLVFQNKKAFECVVLLTVRKTISSETFKTHFEHNIPKKIFSLFNDLESNWNNQHDISKL